MLFTFYLPFTFDILDFLQTYLLQLRQKNCICQLKSHGLAYFKVILNCETSNEMSDRRADF